MSQVQNEAVETTAVEERTEATLVTGKVKWFDNRKGFGYITGNDGTDYFVHRSDIETGRTYTGFNNNDEVTFTVEEGKKGLQAKAVNMTK